MKSANRTILIAGMGTSPAVLMKTECKHRKFDILCRGDKA
jgi:hypothetical protein